MKRNEKGKKFFWLIISEILHSTFLSAFDMKKGRPPLSRTKSRPKKICQWWEKSKCFFFFLFILDGRESQKRYQSWLKVTQERNWNLAMLIAHYRAAPNHATLLIFADSRGDIWWPSLFILKYAFRIYWYEVWKEKSTITAHFRDHWEAISTANKLKQQSHVLIIIINVRR